MLAMVNLFVYCAVFSVAAAFVLLVAWTPLMLTHISAAIVRDLSDSVGKDCQFISLEIHYFIHFYILNL